MCSLLPSPKAFQIRAGDGSKWPQRRSQRDLISTLDRPSYNPQGCDGSERSQRDTIPNSVPPSHRPLSEMHCHFQPKYFYYPCFHQPLVDLQCQECNTVSQQGKARMHQDEYTILHDFSMTVLTLKLLCILENNKPDVSC